MICNSKYCHNLLRYAAAIISLTILWHIASFITSVPFLPAPLDVLRTMTGIFVNVISIHLIYSLWRIFAGIGLSLLIGIPIGFLLGYWPPLDKALSPFIYFLYPIPKIALLPIIMLLFGLGDASKIIMIMLIVVFQVLIACRDSVKSIPEETYHSLYSLGAGPADIFRKIVIPASIPGLLTSIRVSLGTALSVLFFTETFGTTYGMGYFIMDSWMRVNYMEMYSGIVVLSAAGFLLFIVVDTAERLLCPWKKGQ